MLRTSRLNPNLSAYSQIVGSFDFNRTPIAPLGTKLLIHEKPGPRASWSPHAIDGWYIGPALRHYRCFRVWATATNAERIADTIVWFPEDYFMPRATQLDSAAIAAYELTQALIRPRPPSLAALYPESMQDDLLRLATIFKNLILSDKRTTDHVNHSIINDNDVILSPTTFEDPILPP